METVMDSLRERIDARIALSQRLDALAHAVAVLSEDSLSAATREQRQAAQRAAIDAAMEFGRILAAADERRR